MIQIRTIVILVCGFAQSAQGQRLRSPLRERLRADVIGCYALYFEGGRVDGSLFNASPSVRLDSSSAGRPFRSMVALTQSHGPFYGRHGPFPSPPHWSADSLTDSVRLSFVDGFSGAVFVLSAPAGHVDTLRGRVFEFWDAGPPHETPRGAARAIREPCNLK